MFLAAIIMGNLVRQWLTKKMTNAWSDDKDIDLTNIELTNIGLTDIELTDTSEHPSSLCDCESCNPVILEDLISRPGEIIIDIGDDPPHLFHARNYDQNYDQDYDQNYDQSYDHDPDHEDHDHYLNFDNPWDNPWDGTTSDYDSQDTEDKEIHNQEFPSIWHELVHDLMELEQIGGLRR